MKLFERREIDITMYQSDVIQTFFSTEREARREYSRLRAVAQKRLARLEKRAEDEEDIISREARRIVDQYQFKKLSDIQGQDVYTQLERIAKFINSPFSSASTLREYKRRQLQSLRENPTILHDVKVMKEAEQALDKDDLDEAQAMTEDEPEEDEEPTDEEIDRVLQAYQRLDEWGLTYLKYDDEITEYLTLNQNVNENEFRELAFVQEKIAAHEKYLENRRAKRNRARRNRRRS